MKRKPSILAAALKAGDKTDLVNAEAETDGNPVVEAKAAPAPSEALINYVAPSRRNKTAKTHFLSKGYWETLEELSFRTRDENGKRMTQTKLVEEALNLLFVKYNYPVVRGDE